jgi:PBSX family phage terminase large subunit
MAQHQNDLYGNQFTFLQDTRHFTGLCGGIGSGKSFAGAARGVSAASGIIGSLKIAAPNTGMVTAPTYNILRDATIPAFREMAGGLIASMNASYPINATMRNGSTIMFRSAHQPEMLRGPSISWWWGDEAALYHKSVWGIMIGRLRQGGKLGYAWLTTTPKGRNWLYKEFKQQQRDDYHLYKLATWQNPFIDEEYYLALTDSYAGDFAKQELEGDFVAFEGLIYAEFDRDVHMPLQFNPPASFKRVVAGVDWGYANPGVITVYGVDSDDRMWGVHEEYARRRRIGEWAEIAAQLQAQYNIEAFYCDPAEPGFIDEFRLVGCHAVAAVNDVLPGIQAVKARLAVRGDGLPRLVLSSDFVNAAAEFEQYQWAETSGEIRDKPNKSNDHCMDSLRYAVMGVDYEQFVNIDTAPDGIADYRG